MNRLVTLLVILFAYLSLSTIVIAQSQNQPPVFDDGDSTTRSVAENTAAGTNIGLPISATDPDDNRRLLYQLSGKDKKSFDIGRRTGQLITKASLDYETKSSYTQLTQFVV